MSWGAIFDKTSLRFFAVNGSECMDGLSEGGDRSGIQLALFRNLFCFLANCHTMYLIMTFSKISSIIWNCSARRSIEIDNNHDIYMYM